MKAKILTATALAILILTHSSPAGPLFGPRSDFKVTVTVVDDKNIPVPGADIGFSWGRIGGSKPDTDSVHKLADKNGTAEFTGVTKYNQYAYGADKKGFYSVPGIDDQFTNSVNGRWQPCPQSLTIVIKPIKNPVPMYAKKIITHLPELGKPCGYDLETGDWVAPYGKGVKADFEFTGNGSIESDKNYTGTLTLRLPGDNNGIHTYDYQVADLRSELKMPYEAPTNGYASSWTWQDRRTTENKPFATSKFVDESNSDRGFIFRVRTALDSQGNMVRANYGKIHGPVVFYPKIATGKWVVGINYYFNPDRTLNLEFDPKHNLFTNLKSDERVYDP